jgi:3-dehydroquinate synthase
MDTQIIFTNNVAEELQQFLDKQQYDKVFLLADDVTEKNCLPIIGKVAQLQQEEPIVIKNGDQQKDIENVQGVWHMLAKMGASRHSALVNLGGGMITDLGGFAAATFKRGIHTVNVPTTLMGAVDAATGGKTGVNFMGLKNEIGAFHHPDAVVVDCQFLKTLDRYNFLSGYAEMIKHALIHSQQTLNQILAFTLDNDKPIYMLDPITVDINTLSKLVKESVLIKENFVKQDPNEQGVRKALNLGHTTGHALESLSFKHNDPVLHGHAVAAGLVCELFLSYKITGFPTEQLHKVTNFVKQYFPTVNFQCNDYTQILQLMTHDKKNTHGVTNFTLLSDVGNVLINQTTNKELIEQALDFYQDECM